VAEFMLVNSLTEGSVAEFMTVKIAPQKRFSQKNNKNNKNTKKKLRS
jgi:hypothetical protein